MLSNVMSCLVEALARLLPQAARAAPRRTPPSAVASGRLVRGKRSHTRNQDLSPECGFAL